MNKKKFRWSKVYESSEEELADLLRARNISATRTVAEPSGEQLQQISERERTIWCGEGWLIVRTKATSITLQPGDATRVSAHTPYDLQAGEAGCTYYVSG